ncbi:hypothetical protein OO013_08810 [Mangrovivirga sp. M17]|uniref:Uncharacterized protein n=1 Tax=Mangrovivirga halotolerans TaxID=2993936 RepID=A0ABT3RRG1_9BACT|nr:hypothetical protein [Mangrovivirga halotolerans]MCX2743964.1 hypothetical protein [Mangrovivirga halotolerans]
MPSSNNKYKTLSIILIILLLFASIFIFTDSENDDYDEAYKQQVDSLTNENNKLNDQITEMKAALLIPHDNKLKNNLDNDTSNDSQGFKEGNLNVEEKNVVDLVNKMHQGYEQLNETGDPEVVLKYFTPRHSTNEVSINVNNIPSVKNHNTNNFKEHLQSLANVEGLEIQLGKPYFKNIYVRENIFNTHYVANLTVRLKGEVVEEAVLIATISGEKKGNDWRIGNFSWMKFDQFGNFRLSEGNSAQQ